MGRCLWCAKCVTAGAAAGLVLAAVLFRLSDQFDTNLWMP